MLSTLQLSLHSLELFRWCWDACRLLYFWKDSAIQGANCNTWKTRGKVSGWWKFLLHSFELTLIQFVEIEASECVLVVGFKLTIDNWQFVDNWQWVLWNRKQVCTCLLNINSFQVKAFRSSEVMSCFVASVVITGVMCERTFKDW